MSHKSLSPPTPKIQSLEDLVSLRELCREQHRVVVWTNGCFDLLHAGHVRNLRDAKALGDILIVGVNSDASVRANKGPARPLVGERDRAEVIAALEMVDYVTIFHEPTPVEVLIRLRPDIHCKGQDYGDGTRAVPEAEIVRSYGGQIRFLPFHPGRSTSDLIERIAQSTAAERPCGQ